MFPFSFGRCFLSLSWWLWLEGFFVFVGELDLFKILHVDLRSLLSELQTQNCLDIANVLLDREKLVHQSAFKLVLFLRDFASFTEAFEQNILLVRAFVLDCSSH